MRHPERSEQRERSEWISDSFVGVGSALTPTKPVPVSLSAKRSLLRAFARKDTSQPSPSHLAYGLMLHPLPIGERDLRRDTLDSIPYRFGRAFQK